MRSVLAELHDQPSDLKIGADHIPLLGGIALPAGQQALQFLSELPHLLDLAIDPLDLALQVLLDIAAGAHGDRSTSLSADTRPPDSGGGPVGQPGRGVSLAEFVELFPGLTLEQARSVLEQAARSAAAAVA